jgi:hypothetical protein
MTSRGAVRQPAGLPATEHRADLVGQRLDVCASSHEAAISTGNPGRRIVIRPPGMVWRKISKIGTWFFDRQRSCARKMLVSKALTLISTRLWILGSLIVSPPSPSYTGVV